ncbi:MAG: ABC transporter ATP-binding protein [Myxococcota bacterium]|nr:ABC transporter ATP-binding protein [Myxococcota bacterium]
MIGVESAGFGYEGRRLFDGVSFRVDAGEALAILGPNGAGKTTLLRILAGILRPATGIVRVDGRDVHGMTPVERALRVAYVPQGVDPTVPFTVFETVLMGRYAHLRGRWEREADRDAARRAIAAMGLDRVVDRPMARLSGGERQRTMIAAALAQEAPVLLMDEPTTALDLRARWETLGLLERLRVEEARTLVVVTHDIDLAARSCGRVLLLGAPPGAIEGPASEVLVPERLGAAYGVGIRAVEVPGEPVPLFVARRADCAGDDRRSDSVGAEGSPWRR